jgi:hypothetical protein
LTSKKKYNRAYFGLHLANDPLHGVKEKRKTRQTTKVANMEVDNDLVGRAKVDIAEGEERFFGYNEDKYLTLDRSHHNLFFPMPCYPIWTPASILGSCQEAGLTTTLYSLLSKYHVYCNSVLERTFCFLIQSYQGPIIYLFGTFH